MKKIKILVTGAAGFIGFHLVKRLVKESYEVYGLDNLNAYYDVKLKKDRLKETGIFESEIIEGRLIQSNTFLNYKFIKEDLTNLDSIINLFKSENFDIVINLAAQAGVRYAIENPKVYVESNVQGFLSILEGSAKTNVKHLIYASTSSVYGVNTKLPFSTQDNTNHPISLYAATKKTNELMAHSYSYLYNLPTTGLRFFTVYGPWGRPDMALFKFANLIYSEKPIEVYNYGNHKRDFTYIDDIIEGIFRILNKPPIIDKSWDSFNPNPSSSSAPWKIYNIGNNSPVKLSVYINELENAIGKKAKKVLLPLQSGDVLDTFADIESLKHDFDYMPKTDVRIGVQNFVKWYKNYFKIS